MSYTEKVRKVALESGASLVGFAPISRFDNAPPEFNPRTIFPQTKSVIAIALPQERGALKTIEEGTYWQAYNVDNYYFLNDIESARILRQIILFMEKDGFTGVPVHNPFFHNRGQKLRDDQPVGPDGMVSLRVVGVACGLGELGHNKMLLTPEFGPRQRVFAVFTDAELEPTPLFKGKICDGCLACVRECEANAIGKRREIKVKIEDCEYCHAALDITACGHVHPGREPQYSPFWKGDEAEGQLPSYHKAIWDRFGHLAICAGRGCIRSCLDHLEKTGKIGAKFMTPMIQRERWKVKPVTMKQTTVGSADKDK